MIQLLTFGPVMAAVVLSVSMYLDPSKVQCFLSSETTAPGDSVSNKKSAGCISLWKLCHLAGKEFNRNREDANACSVNGAFN